MQAASHRFSSRRWLVPVVLVVAAPLLFSALPKTALSGGQVGAARDIDTGIAALNAVRTGFLQARMTERGVLSNEAHDNAVAAIRRALDTVPAEANIAGIMTLRSAVETYARNVTPDRVAAEMVPEPRSAKAIDAMIGQLPANDEAMLREPLAGLRLAAAAQSGDDPWTGRQLAYWADIFAARLETVTLPAGTRTRLAHAVAMFEHDQSGMDDPAFVQTRNAAAHDVEAALANAGQALASGQASESFIAGTSRERLWWLFAALVLASTLAVAGGGFAFGRATAGHGSDHHHRGQWDHA